MGKKKNKEADNSTLSVSVNGGEFSKPLPLGEALDRMEHASMIISAPKKAGIKVVKVKLIDDMFAEIHYVQYFEGAKPNKIIEEGGNLIHEDLLDSLARFRPHLAVIKDMKESMIYDEQENMNPDDYKLSYFNRLKVTGIVITGEDDQEGFMIIGQKIIGTRVFNELTSNWKFQDEQDPYKFMPELFECIEHLNNEVELYLHGKFGKPTQPSLEFPEHPEENQEPE